MNLVRILIICVLCLWSMIAAKASQDTLRVQWNARTMLEFVYWDRLDVERIENYSALIKSFTIDYEKLPVSSCASEECIYEISYYNTKEKSQISISERQLTGDYRFVIDNEEVVREKGCRYVVYFKGNPNRELRIYAADLEDVRALIDVDVDKVLQQALLDLRGRYKRRWGVSTALYDNSAGQIKFEAYKKHTTDILLIYPTASLSMYNRGFMPGIGGRLGFMNTSSSFSDGYSLFISYQNYLLYGEKQEKNLYWKDYASFLSLDVAFWNDMWGDNTWMEFGVGMLVDHSSPQAFPKDAYLIKLKTYYGKLGIGLDIIGSESYDDNYEAVLITVDFSGLLFGALSPVKQN